MPHMIRHLTCLMLVLAAHSPAAANSRPKLKLEDAVRLQIFLDESHHGPGVIDGRPGHFTSLAVASWNEANGHPADDWQEILKQARKSIRHPFATAVVPETVETWVDSSLPYDRPGQAKKKRMSYRRVTEFMAERYHCDEDFLHQINKHSPLSALKARDSIIVPNVTPFRIEEIGGAQHDDHPELSKRYVVVDTKANRLRIYHPTPAALVVAKPGKLKPATPTVKNNGLVASFPITPGQPQFIAFGIWQLRNMVELPWWRYDQTFLDTGERGPEEERLNIPPGPNSPVGIIWNGTSKPGIGLHGTSDPETIGRAHSAGCIRLCNWDAARLPQLVRPGASIEIR